MDGQVCDPDLLVCKWRCSLDADCLAEELPFGDARICGEDGECGFQACQVDADCRQGTLCFEARCVLVEPCPEVATCRVFPAELVLRPGETARVFAQATLASGQQAPGLSFEWTSDAESVATFVDGSDGLVTAGGQAGRAHFTASVPDCTLACDAEVVNLGAAPANALRVAVVDGRNGGPLPGATVEVEGAGSASTDLEGLALFPGLDLASTPARVRVSAAGLTPLDLLAAASNDLRLTLEPSVLEGTGGFRAPVSFQGFICGPDHPCEVRVALAGLSIPLNFLARPPERILGERLKMPMSVGGTSVDWLTPGGTVIGMNQVWFHEQAEATGPVGQRLAWALGQKTDLSKIIELAGPMISGGTTPSPGAALAFALRDLLGGSSSGLTPGLGVQPVGWAADTLDRDGDGRWDDLVPRYQDLPPLAVGTLRLPVPTSERLIVLSPAPFPPFEEAFAFEAVLVVALLRVPAVGLVPVGVGGELDTGPWSADPGDGVVPDVELRIAEATGRLPEEAVERLVVAVAMGGTESGLNVVGQVHRVERFEGELTLRPFAPPPSVSLDPLTRRVQIAGLAPEVDALGLLVQAPEESFWQILAPAVEGEIELPEPPPGMEGLDGLVLAGLELADGASYPSLVSGQGVSLGELVLGLDGFSLAWSEGAGPDCGCRAGVAGSGLWLLLLVMGAGLLRRSPFSGRTRRPGQQVWRMN